MGGGTEAFPDLGRHCQHADCLQLEFLPFICNGCHKVFCLEHRSYKDHECPESERMSRKVVACEACSVSIETTGKDREDERLMMEGHLKSGSCDPAKKNKPRCRVGQCTETLPSPTRAPARFARLRSVYSTGYRTITAARGCRQQQQAPAAWQWNEKLSAALGLRDD